MIGAGKLGRGIACATALAGYRTILEDILPASLRRAQDEIRDFIDQSVHSGKVSRQRADAALARLEYAGSVEEAARQADLVIEAVPDELESKLEILVLLDKLAKPPTILVSTTATLRVTEIASITYRASKIVGLRFSNPGEEIERLEIVRGAATDDEVFAACVEVGRRMGREVVVIQEE